MPTSTTAPVDPIKLGKSTRQELGKCGIHEAEASVRLRLIAAGPLPHETLHEVLAHWRYSSACSLFDEVATSMGVIEMARTLGVSKALVSKLIKAGMPLTTPQAAQAWREINAPPRKWKGKDTAPTEKPQSTHAPSQSIVGGDDPESSLQRAREAEAQSYAALVAEREGGASAEDLRKLSATYFAARRNRQTAEDFAEQWQRRQRITLLYDEAVEIVSRPHNAAKQMLEVMPKSLAPRLYGQPQKAIERALGVWADSLTAILRESL